MSVRPAQILFASRESSDWLLIFSPYVPSKSYVSPEGSRYSF